MTPQQVKYDSDTDGRGVLIQWQSIQKFTHDVFSRMGMSEENASVMGEVLTGANLRGQDSHGVHLIPRYTQAIRDGYMNAQPNVRVVKETPACLVVDADLSFGHTVSTWAMNKAMEKAKQVGIGYVLLKRTTHQGAMYYYPLMAAQNDMLGFAWVATQPGIAPYGGMAKGVGSNPMAMAAPADKRWPLVLDMALSVVASLKFAIADHWGHPIPEGWALDNDGNPMTDGAVALAEGITPPIGGYKGSGLGIMGEAMMSLLAGAPFIVPILSGQMVLHVGMDPQGVTSMMYAIDIAAFTDVAEYKANVDKLIDELKKVRKVPGVDEILVPGEIEFRTREKRMRDGIPFPPAVVEALKTLAQELKVASPF